MKKKFVLTVVLILAMTGFAWAGTDAGYKELGVNGSFTQQTNSEDSSEMNQMSFGVVFNYFFSAYFSIGANYRIIGTEYNPDGGETSESATQVINLRTDLLAGGPTKTVIPYIGLHGGNVSVVSGDYDYSSFGYGLQGGLKIFPSERVSVNLELDYTITKPDEDFAPDGYEEYGLGLFVGASFYF